MSTWFAQHLDWWVVFGLLGQGLFSLRFIVQWVASERARQSVVPEIFWYFSVAGGLVLLIYAIQRQDIVFTIGQGMGLLIYMRNIWLIKKPRRS